MLRKLCQITSGNENVIIRNDTKKETKSIGQ